jgi:2-haloalkanoic acid dehalogenase type II
MTHSAVKLSLDHEDVPMALTGDKPTWLTFDCYGTLIQWDEGLLAAIELILTKKGGRVIDRDEFIRVYDRYEHEMEQEVPYRSFKQLVASALTLAMLEFSIHYDENDAVSLVDGIGKMPPFPEVVTTLSQLKSAGFKLAIISNTDDAIIAGNVAQLGGHVDRVITAQQALAYKPDHRLFEYAWDALGVDRSSLVHICASPHLDLAAAREMDFRTIWVDRGTGRMAPERYAPDEVVPNLGGVPSLFRSLGWI